MAHLLMSDLDYQRRKREILFDGKGANLRLNIIR
jgi:hypothetical protein